MAHGQLSIARTGGRRLMPFLLSVHSHQPERDGQQQQPNSENGAAKCAHYPFFYRRLAEMCRAREHRFVGVGELFDFCKLTVLVDVQVCRGPTGERLKRSDWAPLGRGRLTIGYVAPAGNHALTATLDKRTPNGPRSLTWPLFDVRVRTYGALSLALDSDPDWRPFKIEGYLFVAAVYFAFCWRGDAGDRLSNRSRGRVTRELSAGLVLRTGFARQQLGLRACRVRLFAPAAERGEDKASADCEH